MDEYRLERMKAAVRTLLKSVGEDVEREGLADTPKASNVACSWLVVVGNSSVVM